MRSFFMIGSLVSLAFWASPMSNASASDAPLQRETIGEGTTWPVFTVLHTTDHDGLLLVQGRGGRGGGSGPSFGSSPHFSSPSGASSQAFRGNLGGSGRDFSGQRQSFYSGPGHDDHRDHYDYHHKHYYPYNYRYPYYYGYSYYNYPYYYPYSSYYQGYNYTAPAYSSPTPIGPGQTLAPQPNPPPSGAPPIQIVNPMENRVALSFTLNGTQTTLQPGETRDLQNDRQWVIQFDRGAQFGTASYSLDSGVYTFAGTSNGWELYHQPPNTFQPGNPAPPASGSPPFPGSSLMPQPFNSGATQLPGSLPPAGTSGGQR